MKIKKIKAGAVYHRPEGWKYNYLIQQSNGWTAVQCRENYRTELAAKTAMRNEVYQQRKRHGLLDSHETLCERFDKDQAIQATANDL